MTVTERPAAPMPSVPASEHEPGLFERPWVRIVFAICVVTIAFVALHAFLREVRLSDVETALGQANRRALGLAVLLTAAGFVALSCYDLVAVRIAAPGRIPARIAMATGAAAYAVSNMLGFALLTGGTLRYRIYASLGLDMATVGNVMATSWVSFWMGIAVLAGGVLLFDPAGMAGLESLAPGLDRWIGAAILVLVAGFFVWLATGRRTVRIRAWRLTLPSLPLALTQTAIAILDIGTAALALYVLMPGDVSGSFALFFVAYVAAIAVGIVSHSPGGLGTFEATLIATLGAAGRADVLAALILYRLIYYVLPFLVTVVGLAVLWSRGRAGLVWKASGKVARTSVTMTKAIAPLVPPAAAATTLLAGIVLLFSGSLPADAPRIDALEALVPLGLVEVSHLLGSALGVVLLVLARGLHRRQRRAWVATLVVLGLGIAASILKGLDVEEAASLTLAALVLATFRGAFYRRAGDAPFRLSWEWALGIACLVGASIWLGLFAYKHVEYAGDLWWRFAWGADAPRFLRASVTASVVALGFGVASVVWRTAPVGEPQPIPEAVRRLVATSAETEANIALLGDKRFLVSPNEDAFLMYAATRIALIAKSDPFGAHEAGVGLAWSHRENADRAGLLPAFYAVGTAYLPTYLDMGLSILKIGEIARVDLNAFSLDGARRKELRYARTRALKDGLVYEIVPARDVPSTMDALARVSNVWMEEKHGEEKGFALGGFDPAYLASFDHAVMREGPGGRIVAFANLWLGAGREELSVDLMRYDPQASKFAMNALFAEIMLWGKGEGYRWFNLGAAPFAGLADHPLASAWNRIGTFVYRHGEEVYHFEGLRAFKEKFDPVWTPNYLACPGGLAAPRVLLEVNRLISGGVRGLLK